MSRTPAERAARVSLIRAAHVRVIDRKGKPTEPTPEFGPFGALSPAAERRVWKLDRAEAARFDTTEEGD